MADRGFPARTYLFAALSLVVLAPLAVASPAGFFGGPLTLDLLHEVTGDIVFRCDVVAGASLVEEPTYRYLSIDLHDAHGGAPPSPVGIHTSQMVEGRGGNCWWGGLYLEPSTSHLSNRFANGGCSVHVLGHPLSEPGVDGWSCEDDGGSTLDLRYEHGTYTDGVNFFPAELHIHGFVEREI